jgi:hypothetical protein
VYLIKNINQKLLKYGLTKKDMHMTGIFEMRWSPGAGVDRPKTDMN